MRKLATLLVGTILVAAFLSIAAPQTAEAARRYYRRPYYGYHHAPRYAYRPVYPRYYAYPGPYYRDYVGPYYYGRPYYYGGPAFYYSGPRVSIGIGY